MAETLAWADPDHEGNSAKYHTGKACITKGCEQPSGTWWSPHWCFACNVERIKRISSSLDDIAQRAAFDAAVRKAADQWHDLIEHQRKTIQAMVLASGGTLTIKMADRDRKIISEGCSYDHKAGTETWRIWAEMPEKAHGLQRHGDAAPQKRPCGECHLQSGEVCDICGAERADG